MVNVHIDPEFDDDERRRRIFAGDVVVYPQVPEVASFAEFTRGLVTDVVATDAPTVVHECRSPDDLADILTVFKPKFIHHPDSMGHVRSITTALGAAPEAVHADVPKLRTAFPTGGLSTGIAYALPRHQTGPA